MSTMVALIPSYVVRIHEEGNKIYQEIAWKFSVLYYIEEEKEYKENVYAIQRERQ